MLFAVDPTLDGRPGGRDWGADLLVVHHPLFLKPVHGFAADDPEGPHAGDARRRRVRPADRAHQRRPGRRRGVRGDGARARAHRPGADPARAAGPLDKLTVYVPAGDAEALRAALAEAGAGRIGDYDHASFSTPGEGRFRPLDGANPTIGEVGRVEVVDEVRVEVVLPRVRRTAVVAAMLAAHPYEEPAYDVVELADPGTSPTGTGRIGTVPETTLGEFAATVAAALPETAQGVRVAGDPDRAVRRVAVCGGAGDFLLDAVLRTDADVYVTSDLRHHPAGEFLEKDGPALVDVAHWAAEWTWLPVVEASCVRPWAIRWRPG